ncbi:MAG: protein-disulfide reductase DsbD [Candidatus Omnitrophota bacterium]|jgi:thiol:disulfide interchange protein DsbD|nr:MAG: protein-disulfide reductase DsbD [Candidatus Omnitrophota bacterium]
MNRVFGAFCLLVLLIPGMTNAAQPDLDSLFTTSVQESRPAVEQGRTGFFEARLTIAPEHYVYQEQTTITAQPVETGDVAGIQFDSPSYPQPKMKQDPFLGEMKAIYDDSVTLRIPFTVASDASLGERHFNIVIKYQGCSPLMCYMPQTRTFPVMLEIQKGTGKPMDVTPAITSVSPTSKPSDGFEFWLSKGYIFTYVLVFLFGILTSMTPCVYPLIPITVTIFGARNTSSKTEAFTLALTYVLGIAFMYSTLGFAAARTGAVFGQIMSNPWVIGAIAAFFVALGASMLGAFELQLPSSWQSRLGQVGGRGYASAFFMGLVAGVVAAPCTGPVLAGILAYVAKEGNAAFGVSLLFVYSLGLGMLFLLIGTFSGLISRLPKSGGWMEGVKSVFGIILFACALYFLKDVAKILRAPLSFSIATYAIAFVMLIAGIVLGAVHLSFHHSSIIHKVRKSAGVFFCVLALYIGFGSLTVVEAGAVNWHTSLEEGLALARAENKPVMIDFYADWCVVCKEIDAKTFTKEQVGNALNRFVTIKVDLTAQTEENERISKEYEIVGLPLIVFQDSKQNRLRDKRIDGFIGPDDFLKHIEDIE